MSENSIIIDKYEELVKTANSIRQRIDVSHQSFVGGNHELINNDQLDFKTSIILALPSDKSPFKEGDFDITYKGKIINVQISKILNEAQDHILYLVRNTEGIETFLEDVQTPLPLEVCTDNRGKYPYYCARISFPCRLARWVNENSDYEREMIAGYKDEDKIDALCVLNKLFQNWQYRVNKRLVYEDVTLFIEEYFVGNESLPVIQRVCTFASENAFKDAINSFLGFNGSDHVAEIVEKQRCHDIYPDIRTENDLLEFIVHNIENDIIHYIENQYIIQAFWNSGDGEMLRNKPKNEVDIQSILYFFLQLSLPKSGEIEVIKEPDKGVGKPDFLFVYRTQAGKTLHVPLEFKLAHNKKIEHGIARQLPAYMKADKTTCGIYAVMWFKDEDGIIFNEPKNRTKPKMLEFIKEKAKETNEKEGLSIKTLFIDASVRKSASKL